MKKIGPPIPFSFQGKSNPFQLLENQDSEMELEFSSLPTSPTPFSNQSKPSKSRKRPQSPSFTSPKALGKEKKEQKVNSFLSNNIKISNLEIILNLLNEEIKAEAEQDILNILEE